MMQILIYCFTLWLGVYLLRRNWQKPGMRYAGFGLVTYAMGLILVITLPRSGIAIIVTMLPALCWWLSIIHFRQDILFQISINQRDRLRRPRALVVTATIFFAGGLVLMIVPQAILATDFVLLLMGFDLLVLGYSIAVLDADDEGEALLPDALRSLLLTAGGCLIFGGQIALVIVIQGVSDALEVLLLGTLTAVVLLPALAPYVQQWLDRWLLVESPRLQVERSQLQAVYAALPRQSDSLDVLALDETEFARLTRRALAHLGDLERLAASPLIQLPIITRRLQDQFRQESTLARTNELKAILIESIEHLRPSGDDLFGTSDEWRYYNALYFPYVLGLKPYRRYTPDDDLDSASQAAASQAALSWFQSQVPERTLHNWQNKAAQLIARDLREYSSSSIPG
ncbi:MAG TPA: hypothetical protein VHL11_13875 [Phototrophicaceae bacterium]|nr:hypothetical protein [Phototrophicaceae bacterium]